MNWDNKAFVYTMVFYTLMLIVFLFMGFRTPLPLPGEEGILINFGDTETGFGSEEPRPVEETVERQESVEPTQEEVTEEIEEQLTQDYEDAPAVAAPKREPKKKVEVTKPKKKPKEEVKKEEKPVVNPSAMYQGRKESSKSTGSEGISQGTGNQGSLVGDPDAASHSLGSAAGNGIGYDLSGRSHVKLPVPQFSTQKEGTVVVRIRVDRSGKVTFAEPGIKGSTTLDKDLLAAAKRAALSSRFNSKADAAIIQEGAITYIFRLRGR